MQLGMAYWLKILAEIFIETRHISHGRDHFQNKLKKEPFFLFFKRGNRTRLTNMSKRETAVGRIAMVCVSKSVSCSINT